MRYTVKTRGHLMAQVATLTDAVEVAIFVSRKEESETYIYDKLTLVARVIGTNVSILDKEKFLKSVNQSVTVKE